MFQPVFTKEFLEKELDRQVVSFRVAPGSNPGDNFIGAIYALEVNLKLDETENISSLTCNNNADEDEITETVYLVGKFFPSNELLHNWLTKSNIFHKELMTYTHLLEELKIFYDRAKPRDTRNISNWPFVSLVGGKSIDFSKSKGIPVPLKHQPLIKESFVSSNNDLFHYGPMDNFLFLTDVRKTSGFKMASLQSGLDWNHCSLIVEILAGIHATSWAYHQQKLEGGQLIHKFPYLKQNRASREPKAIRHEFHTGQFKNATAIAENYLGKDSLVCSGLRQMGQNACDILEWFHTDDFLVNGLTEDQLNSLMRVNNCRTARTQDNYEPWRVLIHGDCWTNNMLFKYNKVTGLPVAANLIDFQVSRVACPTIDLAYLLFISTTSDFRKSHLHNILQIYYDSFVKTCKAFNCDLLPEFTMKSLQERFHRSKLYAMCMSVVVLPTILKGIPMTVPVLDHSDDPEIEIEINNNTTPEKSHQVPYKTLLDKTIVELAVDMHRDGLF